MDNATNMVNTGNSVELQVLESCAEDVKSAITKHYDGYAVKGNPEGVLAEYGNERVMLVLAATIQKFIYDGHISQENKDWAKMYLYNRDLTYSDKYTIRDIHPGMISIFTDRALRYIKEKGEFETENLIKTNNEQETMNTGKSVRLMALNYLEEIHYTYNGEKESDIEQQDEFYVFNEGAEDAILDVLKLVRDSAEKETSGRVECIKEFLSVNATRVDGVSFARQYGYGSECINVDFIMGKVSITAANMYEKDIIPFHTCDYINNFSLDKMDEVNSFIDTLEHVKADKTANPITQLLRYAKEDGTGDMMYFLKHGDADPIYDNVLDIFNKAKSGEAFIHEINEYALNNYAQISEESYDIYMQLPGVRSIYVDGNTENKIIDFMYSDVGILDRTQENTHTSHLHLNCPVEQEVDAHSDEQEQPKFFHRFRR